MHVGQVAVLTRYPVKSMQSEELSSVAVEPRGLAGDRGWAVYTTDGGIGSGKTTRRFRRVDGLLGYRAWLDGGPGPLIASPTGRVLRAGDPAADDALSSALGRSLTLRPEAAVPHHDESPLHLVTTASLRRVGELAGGPLDPRRVRANLVLEVPGEGFVEDGWAGRHLEIGDSVVLALGPGMPRCVMVDAGAGPRVLPGAGPRVLPGAGPRVLRTLGRARGGTLGLQASVHRPGVIRRGDAVRVR